MPSPADSPFSSHNALFHLAQRGSRSPNLLSVVLLTVGFFLGGQVLGAILLFLLFAELPFNTDVSAASAGLAGLQEGISMALLFIPTAILLWIWLKTYEKRPFWTVGFWRDRAVKRYLRGGSIALLLMGLTTIGMALPQWIQQTPGPAVAQGASGLLGVGVVLGGFVIQGAVEEMICRGWILPVVGARYGWQMGVAVSAIVFALIHSFNDDVKLLAIVNIALIGIFLALYALREAGLWGVCAFHSMWNWTQGNGLGFAVSGHNPSAATLINTTSTGPDWITGGAFGPEGGVMVTVVTLLAIGLLIIRVQRHP